MLRLFRILSWILIVSIKSMPFQTAVNFVDFFVTKPQPPNSQGLFLVWNLYSITKESWPNSPRWLPNYLISITFPSVSLFWFSRGRKYLTFLKLLSLCLYLLSPSFAPDPLRWQGQHSMITPCKLLVPLSLHNDSWKTIWWSPVFCLSYVCTQEAQYYWRKLYHFKFTTLDLTTARHPSRHFYYSSPVNVPFHPHKQTLYFSRLQKLLTPKPQAEPQFRLHGRKL